MAYLHQRQGRFIIVLPRTRAEDAAFRTPVAKGQAARRPLGEKADDEGEVIDRFSTSDQPATTAEDYRLVWYRSDQSQIAINNSLTRLLTSRRTMSPVSFKELVSSITGRVMVADSKRSIRR
jgi:hypothetical protein